MVRDPRNYTIWGKIAEGPAGTYLVTVNAITNDRLGPQERESKTESAPSLEKAYELRIDMVRAMSRRLQECGHTVTDIDLKLGGPQEG